MRREDVAIPLLIGFALVYLYLSWYHPGWSDWTLQNNEIPLLSIVANLPIIADVKFSMHAIGFLVILGSVYMIVSLVGHSSETKKQDKKEVKQ